MRSCSSRLIVQLVLSVFVLYLSACGDNAASSNSSGSTAEHLYVTTATGQILQFILPLTSASTPSVTVLTNGSPIPVGVAVDSNGNLAVTELGGNLAIYHPPLTSSSTPAAIFPNGTFPSVGSIGFDTTGNLFAVGVTAGVSEGVNIFSPPFSSASTPSKALSISGLSVGGLDSSGNLYLDTGSGFGPCGIAVLAQPYTGTPTTVVSRTCNDGMFGQVVVADNLLFARLQAPPGSIDVFPLPGSTATAGGIFINGAFTADSNGNLYVATSLNDIEVFAPPLSISIVPTVSVANVSGVNAMAVGK